MPDNPGVVPLSAAASNYQPVPRIPSAQPAGRDPRMQGALQWCAMQYVTAGWPILALSESGDRLVSGMSPCDEQTAAQWWSQRPYGIGVQAGVRFDVLELPTAVGEPAVAHVRQQVRTPVPVFEIPLRGWFLLVSTGSPRIAELRPYRRLVRLHQQGWLPLPPTVLVGGAVLWISAGRIPHSLVAQRSVLTTLQRDATWAAAIDFGQR